VSLVRPVASIFARALLVALCCLAAAATFTSPRASAEEAHLSCPATWQPRTAFDHVATVIPPSPISATICVYKGAGNLVHAPAFFSREEISVLAHEWGTQSGSSRQPSYCHDQWYGFDRVFLRFHYPWSPDGFEVWVDPTYCGLSQTAAPSSQFYPSLDSALSIDHLIIRAKLARPPWWPPGY
jgi:hypothetical protein